MKLSELVPTLKEGFTNAIKEGYGNILEGMHGVNEELKDMTNIDETMNSITDNVLGKEEGTTENVLGNIWNKLTEIPLFNKAEIPDKTDENIETNIGNEYSDIFKYMEQIQKEQWEREDSIRKETQEREDNAYQRAVKDMQKAGINPNLMNVSPADSGGGITQATGLDYTVYENKMKEAMSNLEQEIDNEFKEDENKKDRFNNLISIAMTAVLAYFMRR